VTDPAYRKWDESYVRKESVEDERERIRGSILLGTSPLVGSAAEQHRSLRRAS